MHGNGPGKFKGTHYPIRFSPERNAAWLDGGSREECRSDSGPVRLCESVVRLGLADGICYWVTSSRLAVRLLVNTIPDLSPICQTLVISRSRQIDQHFEDDYIMFYGAFFDSRFSTIISVFAVSSFTNFCELESVSLYLVNVWLALLHIFYSQWPMVTTKTNITILGGLQRGAESRLVGGCWWKRG